MISTRKVRRFTVQFTLAIATMVVATVAGPAVATADADVRMDAVQVAQAGGTEPRELEPRYKPAPVPEPKSWYNSGYVFGLTRSVAGSTMIPAAKAPLFVLTVPLDIIILPFAAIGGMFG